VEVNKNQLLQI